MARREQYDDEMMDAEQPQRVRSTVSSVRKQKGRGFRERMDTEDPRNGARGSYDTLETGSGPGPAKCETLCPDISVLRDPNLAEVYGLVVSCLIYSCIQRSDFS